MLNVAKSSRARSWGVTFTLVSHHDGTVGRYFHSGVGIDAQDPSHPPPPYPILATLTAVDDGLFTLHHGVITALFFVRYGHAAIHLADWLDIVYWSRAS